MGFLPIFYAGGYLFIAVAAYICISVAGGLDALGERAFVAILSFGAGSLIGFVFLLMIGPALGLHAESGGTAQKVIYSLVYIVPGLVGAWASLKAFKTLKPDGAKR